MCTMKNAESGSIQYDPTEFQDGFTVQTLITIANFHGEEVAQLFFAPVVRIDVGNHPIPLL